MIFLATIHFDNQRSNRARCNSDRIVSDDDVVWTNLRHIHLDTIN